MASIFIIGAGFSHPAGLPLGKDLFNELVILARSKDLYERVLEPDIRAYLHYVHSTRGIELSEDLIDFEDFISYLDLEHFLWLQGKDTLTSHGNKSQMAIRNLLSLLLFRRQQSIPESAFDLYRKFARNLQPWDLIISFNYDTILETVFDEQSIKYRLVPESLESANEYGGASKFPDEDVVLLKMHGSIDWFDRTEFEKDIERLKSQGLPGPPRHPVFKDPSRCEPIPIAERPYFSGSPLLQIFRARHLDNYFSDASFLLDSPLLISPSTNKLVYLNPLREFWYGFSRIGYAETRMSIIGFSLPPHDEYLRVPLYHLVTNYQHKDIGPYPGHEKKSKLVIVDYQDGEESMEAYRQRYKFVDWSKTVQCFDGLNDKSIDLIFA